MQHFQRHRAAWLLACAAVLAPASALAQEADTSQHLGEVVVYGRQLNLLGVAQSASEGVVGYEDFENRPLSRVGEMVENVPGMIATQHSGAGKANQYFLRGFNLDHGTDLAGFVDGAPVNMRTHGHGQGYLDFNFLIPELVERIDYRKGPYFADVGDFSAAGTVKFTTVDKLAKPLFEATAGSFDYYRGLVAGSRAIGSGQVLGAVEGVASNGPWVLDENLSKLNGLLKYSRETSGGGWNVSLMGYHASWTSTDQVPERAIASGAIDRLGYIDPDLGGRTNRISLIGGWRSGDTSASLYALHYDLRLTSNFTYFLEDPADGDEFQQQDRRNVYGGALGHRFTTTLAGRTVELRVGVDGRYDDIGKVGLYRSQGGTPTSTVRQDAVDEYSGAVFGEAQISLTDRLRATLGVRGDAYGYDVDAGLPANGGKGSDSLVAPKLALAWRINDHLETYANYGESFHSNDVRGATITVDPATGDPADRVDVLARAKGVEVGARLETTHFTGTISAFGLDLQSELVFVGDAGSTEPNDASRRYGVEAAGFWRPTDWVTVDVSAAATHARFKDVAPGLDRIPGSVSGVVAAGATFKLSPALMVTTRVRHFGAAPLVEDGAVRSEPTTLVNLGGYYTRAGVRYGVDILNLFNAKDADITYFYASRLPGEPAGGVEDRHLHPVEPFQVRASIRREF